MSTYNKSNIVGGGFQNSSGYPISLGTLTFTLGHDSNVCTLGSPSGMQITAGQTIKFKLDMNGNLCPGQYLWTNDVLTPAGSYYTVTAFDSNGIQVWTSPQQFYFQPYSPTIDIGTLTPLVP